MPKAVVTGAASGIGRAAAQRLLDEGCRVTVVDINREGLEEAWAGSGARIMAADLSSPEDRARVAEEGRGCRHLVNAAGVILLKDLSEVSVEDWRRVFAVNVESIFFLCQGIGFSMPPGGSIVNMSSSSAKLSNTVEAAVYGASKTTILSVTRSFAYRLAEIPVRVNAVCPAVIDTPMQERVLAEVAPQRGMTPDELRAARNSLVPMGRSGTPEEVAGLIWFLLSEESSYMTGQAVNLGGGYVTW